MKIEELRIYPLAVRMEGEVFRHVKNIPPRIEQVNQILRSSSSISANIIEGWNRRFYPKDFLRFLSVALGSSDETQHHLLILNSKNLLAKETFDSLKNEYKNLSIKILNLINYLKKKHNIINVV